MDLNLQGDRLDAPHAAGSRLGRVLLRKAGDVTGQGHDAALRRDADMGGGHARLPAQFLKHGLLQITVANHGILLDSQL